jgi:hypothetical protein
LEQTILIGNLTSSALHLGEISPELLDLSVAGLQLLFEVVNVPLLLSQFLC